MPFLIFSHKIQAEIKSLYANLSINWRDVTCYMFVQVTAVCMLIRKKFLHILTKAQCSARERHFIRMGNIIRLRRNKIKKYDDSKLPKDVARRVTTS